MSKLLYNIFSPHQVAQLVGVLSHMPKGCGFNFLSGYIGCWLDPQLGCGREATDGCFSLTLVLLSHSLSHSLSLINKYILR